MQTSILLLAAGQSSRMRGRDKLLEPVGRTPLLGLQVQRALATGCPVYVTLPSLTHDRAQLIATHDVVRVPVPDAAEGMAASLRAGLAGVPDHDAVLIHLPDLVAIETKDLHAVINAAQNHPEALAWRGATDSGKPGHPILMSPTLRPKFATLTGDTGGSAILRDIKDQTHLVRLPGCRARLDLDTPEDWAAWRAANPQK